jgi:hypothetical protein
MSLKLKKQITIKTNQDRIKRIAGNIGISPRDFLSTIKLILDETLDKTIKDLKEWIYKYVPKRTGQLRDNLIKHIETSQYLSKGLLEIIIGTDLDYAQRVSQMSTRQVRHSSWFEHAQRGKRPKKYKRKKKLKPKRAYAYYYGHHGRIFLNDPDAIGNFWNKLILFLQKRSLVNLNVAAQYYLGKEKKLKTKKLFEVSK